MKAAVCGLINIETTLKISGFPLAYEPVHYPFHGVGSTVSGVGVNVALALHTLGADTALLSLIGDDAPGRLVTDEFRRWGLPSDGVLAAQKETAQSVILYEASGRRQIHVDLKDLQEPSTRYPEERFLSLLPSLDLAVLCNIGFARPLLALARGKVPIATDIHVLADFDDPYNRDFLAAADIVFLSDERLPCTPAEAAAELARRYGNRIVVVGCGARGAWLHETGGWSGLMPPVPSRPVVNTIGAGDALFSAFNLFYAETGDARTSLHRAQAFAGWKIGEKGAAQGFLTREALDRISGL